MKGMWSKVKERLFSFSGKMDRYQESITFAEAGAEQYITFDEPKRPDTESGGRKLLVVGKESTFSRDIIDYSIEMAQRLSYEIIAMNTAPLSCETFKRFPAPRNSVCREFENASRENARLFKETAERSGIPFKHVIKFCEAETAVEEAQKEFGGLDFVISEAEKENVLQQVQNTNRLEERVFVYTLN